MLVYRSVLMATTRTRLIMSVIDVCSPALAARERTETAPSARQDISTP